MNIETPPMDTPIELSAYLVRMFNLVDTVLGNIGKLPVRKLLAKKPVIGKLYYYSQPIKENGVQVIFQEGLHIYKSEGYVFIA